MSAGEYTHYRHISNQSRFTQVAFVATGATGVTLVTGSRATARLSIQRIKLLPTTFATGSLTFSETDATGAVIGVLAQPAAASTTPFGPQVCELDFGPKGYTMTTGKNLFMTRSATGSAGVLLIEAYEGLSTGAVSIATSAI